MDERIEFLREVLHEALKNGNPDEILNASVVLDAEIVQAMVLMCKAYMVEGTKVTKRKYGKGVKENG